MAKSDINLPGTMVSELGQRNYLKLKESEESEKESENYMRKAHLSRVLKSE